MYLERQTKSRKRQQNKQTGEKSPRKQRPKSNKQSQTKPKQHKNNQKKQSKRHSCRKPAAVETREQRTASKLSPFHKVPSPTGENFDRIDFNKSEELVACHAILSAEGRQIKSINKKETVNKKGAGWARGSL
ncbi:hypothetical protein Q3G72_013327 [Acer saccharum]|nr:hypothetical protein Q3G72_013327 [Acer saccharum]